MIAGQKYFKDLNTSELQGDPASINDLKQSRKAFNTKSHKKETNWGTYRQTNSSG